MVCSNRAKLHSHPGLPGGKEAGSKLRSRLATPLDSCRMLQIAMYTNGSEFWGNETFLYSQAALALRACQLALSLLLGASYRRLALEEGRCEKMLQRCFQEALEAQRKAGEGGSLGSVQLHI